MNLNVAALAVADEHHRRRAVTLIDLIAALTGIRAQLEALPCSSRGWNISQSHPGIRGASCGSGALQQIVGNILTRITGLGLRDRKSVV